MDHSTNHLTLDSDVLVGSSRLHGLNRPIINRVDYMVDHMDRNMAYVHSREAAGGDPDGSLLKDFKARFRTYRENWHGQPRKCISEGKLGPDLAREAIKPLSLDIETAAICDLACPFCYREYIATPDKLMSRELFERLVDQAVDAGIASVKLNWRGEPLLHSLLPEFIAYAKKKGIMETIINTNAVNLSEKKARQLIDAGLDYMIYSFDGGTKETYEKFRVGRFKENSFDKVYGNIRRFTEIREEMGALFPYTRIQMILVGNTFHEQEEFFELFGDCVDDVSVTQYTERGGGLEVMDEPTRLYYEHAVKDLGLPMDTPYMVDAENNMFLSKGRLPCEQIYQRLMVTYDGKVGKCCHDWGAKHTIGYVDELAIQNGTKEYQKVIEGYNKGKKGFQYFEHVKMPEIYNEPEKVVKNLEDIWTGEEIDLIRRAHLEGRIDDLEVCRVCSFKDTFDWHAV